MDTNESSQNPLPEAPDRASEAPPAPESAPAAAPPPGTPRIASPDPRLALPPVLGASPLAPMARAPRIVTLEEAAQATARMIDAVWGEE